MSGRALSASKIACDCQIAFSKLAAPEVAVDGGAPLPPILHLAPLAIPTGFNLRNERRAEAFPLSQSLGDVTELGWVVRVNEQQVHELHG